MKNFIVAFLLAGIAFDSCLSDDFCKGKKDGHYTYPPNCHKFYQCSNGRTFVMPCPANLWFSPQNDTCERPADIKPKPQCKAPTPSTLQSNVNQPRTTAPKPTNQVECNGGRVGPVPHASVCSKFVLCSGNGLGVVKTCKDKTNFDPDLRVCVWENLYDCIGPNFCKGKNDGDYAHASLCDRFYKCVGGLTYTETCPANLYYNSVKNQCDYPQNVQCPGPVTTPAPATTKAPTQPPATTSNGPLAGFCSGKNDGNYEHPSRCDQFISCVAQKIVYIRDCPSGLYYNKATDQCDWPRNVNCPSKSTSSPVVTTKTPTQPPATSSSGPLAGFCNGKSDGNYAHPSRCDQFISCVAQKLVYVRDCSAGLYYNPKTDQCDWPRNVNCPPKTTLPPTTTTTTKKPTTSTTTTSTTTTTLPPTTTTTTTTQKPTTSTTTTTTTTTTTQRPTTSTTTTTTEAPTPSQDPLAGFCNGKSDGNYEHPSRCDQFISCVAQKIVYIRDCPAGLYYNKATDQCDWPRNVNCPSKSTASPPATTPPPVVTTEAPTQPPVTPTSGPLTGFCNNKIDGNYVHPSRCDQFISCVAQKIVYIRPCPSGLYYNKATDQCDWPRNVVCPTPTPTKKPRYCDGKKPGLYGSPDGKCDSYVICTPDGMYHMKCPPPMLFDKIKKSCQPANTVNCNVSAGPAAIVKDAPQQKPHTPQTPGSVKCNGVGGFPLTGSCTQYVSCNASGVPVIKSCPRGTNFHPKYRVCVWEDNYPCKDGKHSNFCHDKKDGNYVDPTRCDGYIACSGHLRYPMKCPGNLWYDVRQDACDNPHNVQCNVQSTTVSTTTTTTTPPTTLQTTTISPNFCQLNKVGNHADPSRCDTYISCDDSGRGVRMPCPKGLYYNSKFDICDYPRNVKCTVQARREINSFSCNGRAGSFKTGFGCNTYFFCDGTAHTPQLKTCPKHHNFHPSSMKCVWSYSYSCEDPGFCAGKENGKYTNPYNCYGYYICKSGAAFPRNCAPLLRFDGTQCVPASQFVCHGAVIN